MGGDIIRFLSANAAILALIGFACSIALALWLFFELVKLGETPAAAPKDRAGGDRSSAATGLTKNDVRTHRGNAK